MLVKQYIFKVNNKLEDRLNHIIKKYAMVKEGEDTLAFVYNKARVRDPKLLYCAYLLNTMTNILFNNYREYSEYSYYEYENLCAKSLDCCLDDMQPLDDIDENNIHSVAEDVNCILKNVAGRLLNRQIDMVVVNVINNSIGREEIFNFSLHKNLLTFRFNDKYKTVKLILED